MTQHPRPERIDLGPAVTRLPEEGADSRARALAAQGTAPVDVARQVPASSYAWAVLAEGALEQDAVTAYAFARTGYHRGLDALRRGGWRGVGAVPCDHEPNQGFLRALLALAQAAAAIGEDDEAQRCEQFLVDCGTDSAAVAALR
ncbi:uncharacterized protein DUF3151 [Flavimobilis soli]|uniref:Uncharacterized protein DUF3151 n=1 Tax=Flavimobilis soli TaxID=442709 RepID=A0A2A9EFR2_9MICO|nr:DUF3151 domain-containing protein [Flavimobilis soli]PFG37102.1 uncharacterized protein DUF3151 [Flavimobilis soli]